jgi:hypothetical protein
VLHAIRGEFAAAIKALQRGLDSPNWADGQRRGILLAHLAFIATQADQLPLAKRTLDSLKKSAGLIDTPGCEALFHKARAEVALAEGDSEGALGGLRDALRIWLEVGSRINAAHTRLRLAEILARSGETHEAELECSAAEKAFAVMGAKPMVARCGAVKKIIRARR